MSELVPKKRRRKFTTDPEGFIVLTRRPSWTHVTWCKTDAGVALSRKESDMCTAAGYPVEVNVIGVSALLRWAKAEHDELEALFKL